MSLLACAQGNYLDYHREIIQCEQFIVEKNYQNAIRNYDSLFNRFEIVFLRDCKVAAGLCAYEEDRQSAIRFIRRGISNGWALEGIEKNKNFKMFENDPEWEKMRSDYDSLHKEYTDRLNFPLKQRVREMYKKDQKKALGALFRIGQRSKTRYAEKKFAPHSEKQMAQMISILDQHGYPGEQLIGNNWWAPVILSHHNSISEAYNLKDTLYSFLRPKLIEAVRRGELSPYSLATIEDWRTAGLNEHNLTSYGYLGKIPNDSILHTVNKNRAETGLRSIELRNRLIDVEKETGLNLHLQKDWQKGKIKVAGTSN